MGKKARFLKSWAAHPADKIFPRTGKQRMVENRLANCRKHHGDLRLKGEEQIGGHARWEKNVRGL